jgi:hypothetical protein
MLISGKASAKYFLLQALWPIMLENQWSLEHTLTVVAESE